MSFLCQHIYQLGCHHTVQMALDTGQLDIAVFQNTNDTVFLGNHMLYQLVAVTGQVTKFALFTFRYVTRFQQTCQKQLTDPCAVFLIRLMTGHIFDMPGVHYPDFHNGISKNLVDRFPVNTGAFYSHMGDTIG